MLAKNKTLVIVLLIMIVGFGIGMASRSAWRVYSQTRSVYTLYQQEYTVFADGRVIPIWNLTIVTRPDGGFREIRQAVHPDGSPNGSPNEQELIPGVGTFMTNHYAKTVTQIALGFNKPLPSNEELSRKPSFSHWDTLPDGTKAVVSKYSDPDVGTVEMWDSPDKFGQAIVGSNYLSTDKTYNKVRRTTSIVAGVDSKVPQMDTSKYTHDVHLLNQPKYGDSIQPTVAEKNR